MASQARASAVGLLNGALGLPPVTFTFRRALSGLRVIAYHEVRNLDAFREHLGELRRHYNPVSAEEVVAATNGKTILPRQAVWVTFDDGHPRTLQAAATLSQAGLRATAFVCPGVIDTKEPFWWQVLDEVLSRRTASDIWPDATTPAEVRLRLKSMADGERRELVTCWAQDLERDRGLRYEVPQATTEQLRAWTDAGHHVGNHTWDHPLLDRCVDADQERQVMSAHEWLRDNFPDQPLVFAYPNGNATRYAERLLLDLGYGVRTLFDHRVARVLDRSIPMSRLRLDADAPLSRCRSVLSGAHPGAFRLIGQTPT